MIRGRLTHPQILAALAGAGHGSKVLVADGNYPHSTARGPNAGVVYLNLAPGLVGVCDVLRVLTAVLPVEHAVVMATNTAGAYVMDADPDIWSEFRDLLRPTDCAGVIDAVERFAFYDAARGTDVCLVIATGEQRIYANLLLTIGVVR